LNIASLSLLLLLASTAKVAQSADFDISKYGGKANGDISEALTSAWKEACAAEGANTVVIPKSTYKLSSVNLQGPCSGAVTIQLDGTVEAPGDPSQIKGDGWIIIGKVDGLTLTGSGTIDGQGATAWKHSESNCGQSECDLHATSLRLDYITSGVVSGITFKDAKSFHVNVFGCKDLKFEHVTITAPATSRNTDGIHIGRSSGIIVSDTTIGTGDDCISIGDGSQNITIQKVECGPGHGISIGSLGKYKNEEPVSGVQVLDCTITGTTNGVRIKTWPASVCSISASDILFKGITMNNVANPVMIDQGYCPYGQCKAQIPSTIKISGLTIEDIKGTSATQEAIQIICSKGVPCENVKITNIDLTYKGAGEAKSVCRNVNPTVSGTQNPPICP